MKAFIITLEQFVFSRDQRVGYTPNTGTIEDMLQDFREFKHRVPTYGGLLLNQDLSQVLLVQVGSLSSVLTTVINLCYLASN